MRRARRLGLIGAGRIGGAVRAALESGVLTGWELTGVLVRAATRPTDVLVSADIARFLAPRPELVVDLAGPGALAAHGEAVLRQTELWTISGVALADAALMRRLESCGRASGHRLRVLSGAIAGLDGVASMSAAPEATLELDIDLPPGPGPAEERFAGTVREAAVRFPHAVNVAVAAALAGPGLDATTIRVRHPGPVPRHRLALHVHSAAGSVRAESVPLLARGVHPVACNVIAALRNELRTIWVG